MSGNFGYREIPSGCQFWPEKQSVADVWSPDEVVRMYQDGFAGAWSDEAAKVARRTAVADAGGVPFAHQACSQIAGTGKGKLSLLFPAMERLFPGCLPGPAQERGDCVSFSSRNAALASLANEVIFGKPDEVTGWYEAAPELESDGIKQGVLSSEYLYWWRGYNGDGWDCATAAEMIRKNGMMVRKNYPELSLNLTKYSGRLAGKYGSQQPPESIAAVGRVHPVRTTTEIQTFEELCDLIANGYGVSSCGSEGFSDTRDENGVSRRSGSGAHAMAYFGVDDRAEVKTLYRGPLVLVMNSWAKWNGGPRRILGTNIEIPEGSFWARWDDVARRYAVAYSSIAGWPRKLLPDYGFKVLG